MKGQDAAQDRPFRLIVHRADGAVLDVVPVDPGEDWGREVVWATLAWDVDASRRRTAEGASR